MLAYGAEAVQWWAEAGWNREVLRKGKTGVRPRLKLEGGKAGLVMWLGLVGGQGLTEAVRESGGGRDITAGSSSVKRLRIHYFRVKK